MICYIYLVVFYGASSKHLEVENNVLYFCSKSKVSNFLCFGMYMYIQTLCACLYMNNSQ